MWPLAVAGLGLRYCVTPLTERLGHPWRKPSQIALRNVVKYNGKIILVIMKNPMTDL